MSLGARANRRLWALRRIPQTRRLRRRLWLAPGIKLHADPDLGLGGDLRSPPGTLAQIRAQMQAPGDWCALHIGLGRGAPGAGLGFACRIWAEAPEVLRPCLRSVTADGIEDSFFPKHILAHPGGLLHVDHLDLTSGALLPPTARKRELVLFLPTQDFSITLADLRVFAL